MAAYTCMYSYNQEGALSEIYTQRYHADGSPFGAEFRVNSSTSGDEKYSDVSIDDNGNTIIAWQSRNPIDKSYDIFVQSYYSDGSLAGSELRIDTGSSSGWNPPSVATKTNNGHFVSWVERDSSDIPHLFYQSYNTDNTVNDEKVEVRSLPPGEFIFITQKLEVTGNGNILVGYITDHVDGSNTKIRAILYSEDKTEFAKIEIDDDTYRSQEKPSLGSDEEGNLLFSWIAAESYDHNRHDLFGQRFNADGTKASEIFRFEKSVESGPDIALNSNGNFTIVWIAKQNGRNRIFAQQFPANFTPAEVGKSKGSGAFGGLLLLLILSIFVFQQFSLSKRVS